MAEEGPPRVTSFLTIRVGVEQERVVIWDTLEITVGRLDTQDIVVPDPEVSRRHAVLQRRGQEFLVEDLGTPLRTLVNGEPIKTQALAAGDLITIGMLEIRFGQTTEPMRPSGNVRFASQLKGLGLPDADDGGRTMLGVAMELPLVPTASASGPEVPVARVVTADGSLEEASGLDLPAPGDDDLDMGSAPVRDLDRLLGESGGLRPPGNVGFGPTATTRARFLSPSPGGDVGRLTLLIEVEGPSEAVETLAESICGKRIEVPPLVLRAKVSAKS